MTGRKNNYPATRKSPPTRPLADRFWEKVAKGDGCWEWQGGCGKPGYGMIGETGTRRMITAHRLSYELNVAPIPEGLWVLHKCDNKKCVRPDHLFLGTPADNTADMWAKGRGFVPTPTTTKLTELDIREIRARYRRFQGKILGAEFGVTNTTILSIVNGKAWRHVT